MKSPDHMVMAWALRWSCFESDYMIHWLTLEKFLSFLALHVRDFKGWMRISGKQTCVGVRAEGVDTKISRWQNRNNRKQQPHTNTNTSSFFDPKIGEASNYKICSTKWRRINTGFFFQHTVTPLHWNKRKGVALHTYNNRAYTCHRKITSHK